MIYFYGLALILVMALLLAGCITNNSYTQAGKEHKMVEIYNPKNNEFIKDSTKKEQSTVDNTATGIHKGMAVKANIGNKESIE